MEVPLKSRAITLHGNKTNFYQELAFRSFFSSLHTKMLIRMQSTLHGETQKYYKKTYILSLFDHITCKNT